MYVIVAALPMPPEVVNTREVKDPFSMSRTRQVRHNRHGWLSDRSVIHL